MTEHIKDLPAECPGDFQLIEQEIQDLLGSPGFLRSQAFQRLRLTALYRPRLENDPMTITHNGLRIHLVGGRLSLFWVDPCDDAKTPGELARFFCKERGRKRGRHQRDAYPDSD